MNRVLSAIRHFLSERFNLSEDRAEEQLIVESITRETQFKGTNLWTLIFAILIASMGLNVNATAVIIGAMLISPLMGPIMGIGLAIGIYDFTLLKKGVKNLLIAAVISIITSALYFFITPLHEESSELLARTHPSVWDVLIAFFGGLAGIVAGTRKEKSNVIPGVAIATALMPPLCTAGYGLATGHWYFFLGAVYLFFINSLLICLATFLIVKHLRFHKKAFSSVQTERKVARYIWIIVIVTIVPSIVLAYRIVQRSIFEDNARRYVQTVFHLSKTQVITQHYTDDGKERQIELLLIGQPLAAGFIDSAKRQLLNFGLTNTALIVHEGLDAKQQINLAEIKASILEDVFSSEKQADTAAQTRLDTVPEKIPNLSKELSVLYPSLKTYALSQQVFFRADSVQADTITVLIGTFDPRLNRKEKNRLSGWLKERVSADSVLVLQQ